MRRPHAVLLAFVVGCGPSASPSDGGMDAQVVDSARPDAGNDAVSIDVGHDASDTGTDAESACTVICTVDDDCSSACRALPGAERCCDTSTGHCFITHAAACPAPGSMIDAGPYCGGLPCTGDGDCVSCPLIEDAIPCCNPTTHQCSGRWIFDECPGTPDAGP